MSGLDQLRAVIAALEAALEDAGRMARYVPGTRHADGVIAPGYYLYSGLDAVWRAFRGAGYDPGARLDYVAWQESFGDGIDDPATIARMTAADLAHLAVRFSRGERFCDGYWHGLIASGALLAAVRRMVALAEPG